MLSKKERLTRVEFDRFFAVGKRIHTPTLQIIFAESPTFHGSVVIPKKVYKKAVDRNKIRRRLYAVLYQFSRQHKQTGTFIIIAKPPVTKVAFALCVAELKTTLENTI